MFGAATTGTTLSAAATVQVSFQEMSTPESSVYQAEELEEAIEEEEGKRLGPERQEVQVRRDEGPACYARSEIIHSIALAGFQHHDQAESAPSVRINYHFDDGVLCSLAFANVTNADKPAQ